MVILSVKTPTVVLLGIPPHHPQVVSLTTLLTVGKRAVKLAEQDTTDIYQDKTTSLALDVPSTVTVVLLHTPVIDVPLITSVTRLETV